MTSSWTAHTGEGNRQSTAQEQRQRAGFGSRRGGVRIAVLEGAEQRRPESFAALLKAGGERAHLERMGSVPEEGNVVNGERARQCVAAPVVKADVQPRMAGLGEIGALRIRVGAGLDRETQLVRAEEERRERERGRGGIAKAEGGEKTLRATSRPVY